MLKWLKSKLDSRKAQFFIISIVIVAASLSTVSSYLSDYSKTQISDSHAFKEIHLFQNIKEEIENIKSSSPCGPRDHPRRRNLEEFQLLTEKELKEKGTDLNITYEGICDGDNILNVTLIMKTSDMVIRDEFEVD